MKQIDPASLYLSQENLTREKFSKVRMLSSEAKETVINMKSRKNINVDLSTSFVDEKGTRKMLKSKPIITMYSKQEGKPYENQAELS